MYTMANHTTKVIVQKGLDDLSPDCITASAHFDTVKSWTMHTKRSRYDLNKAVPRLIGCLHRITAHGEQ